MRGGTPKWWGRQAMASNFDFYRKLFMQLGSNLNTCWSDVAAPVIEEITRAATTRLAIYIMPWGWLMMRGITQESISNGGGRIVRLVSSSA